MPAQPPQSRRPPLVTVSLSTDGKVAIFNLAGTVDIAGDYNPTPAGPQRSPPAARRGGVAYEGTNIWVTNSGELAESLGMDDGYVANR